jgi:hypothetical protein
LSIGSSAPFHSIHPSIHQTSNTWRRKKKHIQLHRSGSGFIRFFFEIVPWSLSLVHMYSSYISTLPSSIRPYHFVPKSFDQPQAGLSYPWLFFSLYPIYNLSSYLLLPPVPVRCRFGQDLSQILGI